MARGGKREGAGRPPGAVNRRTATLRELARGHTEEAIGALVKVLRESESDAAIVSAANALLDRGYGKPSQVLSGDEEGGPIRTESATSLNIEGLNDDQLRALASIRVQTE